MLAIRMQRTGRSGHAQFRVIVQDSRFSPTSGRVVALLGSYNPHTKAVTIDKEKATHYLGNGAQPSPRVAALLKAEGVKLPDWVNYDTAKKATIRNPEKLRRNQPAKPAEPETKPEAAVEEAPAAEAPAEASEATPETPVETAVETPTETPAEVPASEDASETPAAEA